MKKIPILVLILAVFLVATVSAYMPPTHGYIADEAILATPDSTRTQLVKENYEDFLACDLLADISVFYYWSEGFNAIGKSYKQTHSTSLCTRMVNDAENDGQLACAYGVCAHYAGADYISHNKFVPECLERSKIPNGLGHIFCEEKVNDELLKRVGDDLDIKTKQALANQAPKYKEFFRKNLVIEGSDFPFDAMFDAFTAEVVGNDKYSVGFRGFTAVPLEIHFLLGVFFFANTLVLAYLVGLRTKGKSAIVRIPKYFFMFLSFFFVLIIILAYVLFYTGHLWSTFQYISYPVSNLMPTSGWESHINDAIQLNIDLFNNGASATMSQIGDPAGEQALLSASGSGAPIRYLFIGAMFIIIIIFGWLNFRKKR